MKILLLTIFLLSMGRGQQPSLRLDNHHLAVKLYRAARPLEKNFAVSPYSLELALCVLFFGTDEKTETAQQIIWKGFAIPIDNKTAIDDYFNSLKNLPAKASKNHEDDMDPVLKAVSILIVHNAFQMRSEFKNKITAFFNNSIQSIVYNRNLNTEGESIRQLVNKQVSEFTNGAIKDLLQPGKLSRNTPLTVINAVYLQAQWDVEFREEKKHYPFRTGSSKKLVTMISGVMDVPYYEDKFVQVVKLPFISPGDLKFAVYFLLPREKRDKYMVSAISHYGCEGRLKYIMQSNGLNTANVNVSIPEFEIQYSDDLIDDLKKINISRMFNPEQSNFSSIFPHNGNLFLKQLRHKVSIVITKHGIRAAAATSAILANQSSAKFTGEKKFLADKPFLFYVTVQAGTKHYAYEHYLFSGLYIGIDA